MTTPRRCYVHVGLPKTGTSYLQSILRHNIDELAAQGLDLLPPTKRGTHHTVLALRGRLQEGIDPERAFRALERLRAKALAAQGDRALFTHEVLGAASPKEIRRLIAALPGYEIHVVVTVRDSAAALPSAWQQHTKARGVTPFDDFVDEFVSGDDFGPGRRRRHVLENVLENWGSAVPPERVHVVTVPKKGAGPTVLLERFCEVLGVDASRLDVEITSANTSLGRVPAELLRQVNVALGERLPHRRAGYREQARDFLARDVLRPQGGAPARLPGRLRPWFEESAERTITMLTSQGYDVVGDLDDLRPTESVFEQEATVVTDRELLDAATAALADVLVDRNELVRRLRRQRELVAEQKRRLRRHERGSSGPATGGGAPRRLARRIRARLHR